MILTRPKKSALLTYAIQGTQSKYLHDAPNQEHLAELYVCGESLREMAALIKLHAPHERITAVDLSQATKQWPASMRWVKRGKGVWAARHPGSPTVYQLIEGVRHELD